MPNFFRLLRKYTSCVGVKFPSEVLTGVDAQVFKRFRWGAGQVCMSSSGICTIAGGLKAGVEGVEIIRQAVYGADAAGGGPIVCDVL